ncbi:hypothetical protein CAL14_04445 [Bordetella genomosp. 9]|nr:hypothetical protein CAL14_04445 [Bordetella genomosp. 9]
MQPGRLAESPVDMVDADATQKLALVGFMGALAGCSEPAESLFLCLRKLCPGNVYADMGLAMVWTLSDRTTEALCLLENLCCKSHEQHAFLELCRGIAYRQEGRHANADRCFAAVSAAGGPPSQFAALLGAASSAS